MGKENNTQTINWLQFANSDDDFNWVDLPYFIRDYYNYLLMISNIEIEKTGDRADNKINNYRFFDLNRSLVFAEYQYNKEVRDLTFDYCIDPSREYDINPNNNKCFPIFKYVRNEYIKKDKDGKPVTIIPKFDFTKASLASVIWLYNYEKMGIFKILGVLLDDYNYKGKFTFKHRNNQAYTILLEHISLLFRMGVSSNQRDRNCLYERSLGIGLPTQNEANIQKNESFMSTFNNLLGQAFQFYSYRRLDQAINNQANNSGSQRSSVATLTTIKDSLDNLRNQFEPFYYGRNPTNTFLGIATVYATLKLVELLKTDIGIPNSYDKPQDFIPAAYDILVMNKPAAKTESNRFIVYDNCASYGYRLLLDFEKIDLSSLNTGPDDNMVTWLENIEPWVEGYKNAVKAAEKIESNV